MSNSPGDTEKFRDWINIEAEVPFDGNEEALEALVNIKETEFGDVFSDRDTQLDSDEDDGISISFFNEEEKNLLYLRTGEDGLINISLHLSGDDVEESEQIVNALLDQSPSISMTNLTVVRYFDVPFTALDLPIENETESEVVGLRIRRNGANFIIQEIDRDSNETQVLMFKEVDETYSESFSADLINDVFVEMKMIIEGGV